jgi:hypothetical protein
MSHFLRNFLAFQGANLLVSIVLGVLPAASFLGAAIVSILFGAKLIGFLWFNAYPRNKTLFSALFFGFACADIIVWTFFGSFSIYTFFGAIPL